MLTLYITDTDTDTQRLRQICGSVGKHSLIINIINNHCKPIVVVE